MAGALSAMIAAIFSGGVTSDPFFEYTTLLLPGNGTNGAQNNTFLDGSTNNFTITRNGNTTQGTFSPFSQTGWGNYFNGNGSATSNTDNLTIADSAVLELGSSNWTIECWVYPTATPTVGCRILNKNTSWLLYIFNSDGVGFDTITQGTIKTTSAYPAIVNSWSHIAVTRDSNTIKIYINGTERASGTFTGAFNDNANPLLIGNDPTNLRSFPGYISNIRIVIGTAVYTSNFTPPTTPLAAISGTSLLTCQSNRFRDASSNNFTITVNGNTSVVAFSPFNPTASWSAATNGGSGYFDGSGDYLETTSSLSLTGDFTIEFWSYQTQVPALTYPAFFTLGDSDLSSGFELQSTTTTIYYYSSTVNGTFTVSNPLFTWTHFAIVRSGSSVTIYRNGISLGSFTKSGTLSGIFYAGAENYISSKTSNPFFGYQSNIRVVNSVVYSGAFTPPSLAPLTTAGSTSAAAYPSTTNVNTSFASSATSLLLNFTNAGIYDATSKNDLETVGNAQISTTQSKFGGSSISFDGTGDWLLIPDQPPQRIGTGNFTVEMWVYRNSSGTYGLAGKGTGTTGWLVSLNSSNQVVFTYGSSTITSSGTVSATTWTHIAVVREGTSTNQTKIYIGGSNDGTGTVSTDFNQTNSMYIGADRTGGSAANAYVQDVRITNYARYTSNFTPPTAAFPTL